MKNCVRQAVLAAFLLVSVVGASAQIRYSVTPVFSPADGKWPRPTNLNNHGEVIGTYDADDEVLNVGFLYSGGISTRLSVVPGSRVWPKAINSSGQIVGISDAGPFWISEGELVDVEGPVLTLNDINDSEHIVGSSKAESGWPMAMLYEEGNITELGTFSPTSSCPDTVATGINANGQIVGAAWVYEGTELWLHAFLYENGQLKDLCRGEPTAINDARQVVGHSYLTSSAFLYSGGTVQNLGRLRPLDFFSSASDINNSGQIVGWSQGPNDVLSPFLFQNGKMTDLNTLIPLSDGIIEGTLGLAQATAINDEGQIVGWGDYVMADGTRVAAVLLLTPTGASIVATPLVSPSGGNFARSVRVTLSCNTPGAKIHYTTNGKEPTKSSPVYRKPFVVKKSATVKARAFLAGSTQSDSATAVFTKTP